VRESIPMYPAKDPNKPSKARVRPPVWDASDLGT
jgi:hypothetical protein